jgi:subfamily B ATP-binding cassette protein MsbA
MVGDRGVLLSGGQRQRLFIARELYRKPRLLILDEATSALDSESESKIQKSIDELKGSVTVIIVAHRLSTIQNVDYVYIMENGTIVENGSYSDLKSDAVSRLSQLIKLQKA